MTDKETTGTELIRQALRARNAKLNLASFARDLGMSGDRIHAFLFGGVDLTPDQKRAVALYVWGGNTEWDEKTDRLRPTKRDPATPQGVMPQFDPKLLRTWKAGPAGPGPQPAKDNPTPIKPKNRPGWLSGWW